MEESLFVELVGNKVVVKLIDFFLENRKESFTKKEVQEMSGLSKGALFEHWPKVEEFRLVILERELGNTRLYRLNKENPVVKCLLKLDRELTLSAFPKGAEEKEMHVAKALA